MQCVKSVQKEQCVQAVWLPVLNRFVFNLTFNQPTCQQGFWRPPGAEVTDPTKMVFYPCHKGTTFGERSRKEQQAAEDACPGTFSENLQRLDDCMMINSGSDMIFFMLQLCHTISLISETQ